MSDNDIVCDCNSVEVKDVINFLNNTDGNYTDEQIAEQLDIGTRCSCCLESDCPRIDISLEDILKNR